MDKIIRIAVDGPSGAGKSTVARKVAEKLGIEYIDTGAMYRAVALKVIEKGLRAEPGREMTKMLDNTSIDFSNNNIMLDGKNVNDRIRTPEISTMASKCSGFQEVRDKLVQLQRDMGKTKSLIMDGRDIGTNVFTDAEYKFFITATPEERAERRYKELIEKGQEVTYEDVLADIVRRDKNDSERKLNPLRKADDAREVDTSDMSIEDVTNYILGVVEKDGNNQTF